MASKRKLIKIGKFVRGKKTRVKDSGNSAARPAASRRAVADELLAICDNTPFIVLLLDARQRIRKLNKVAETLCPSPSDGQRPGELFRCLHALEHPQGCGFAPHCADCIIRRTILDTLKTGRSHHQVEGHLETSLPGRESGMDVLLCTTRLKVGGQFRVLVLIQDITARKRVEEDLRHSEERYRNQHALLRTLVDLAPDFIFVKDPDSRYLVVNEALAKALGRLPADILNHTDADLLPVELAARLRAVELRVLGAETGCASEERITFPDGRARVLASNTVAFHDQQGKVGGLVGISHDITERKRAEEHIARLSRVQTILAAIDRAIVHFSEPQKLMDEICQVAVKTGGFGLAWVGMVMPDGTVQSVAQAGATAYLDGIRVVVGDEPQGRGPAGTAIRENRPVVIGDIDRNECMAPWQARALRFGLRYAAAFPLRIAGKAAGAFTVYAPRADFFDDSELGLLGRVSDDISYALTAISDVTARRQAEEALRRSEHNLSTFFNQAPIGLVWLAASGTILRANQAQLDLLGYAEPEYVGRNFNEFHSETGGCLELLKQLAAKQTVRNLRMTACCKNGLIRYLLLDANPVWAGDELLYSSVFLRDITDRVELEQEILDARQGEHRRIAHDLHDGLGQLLVGVAYLTSNLRQDLAAKSLPEARPAGRILEVVNEAIAQTRQLARGLHPVEPEPNGLMVALKTLALRTKKLFQLRCQFSCRSPVLIQDNSVATQLFWIAQEAVTNAIKHGRPRHISLSLTSTPEGLRLTIKDDGAGLPLRPHQQPGMGLRIMRYRAGMINGSLTVQKAVGGGVAIICSVHLSEDHNPNPAREAVHPKY